MLSHIYLFIITINNNDWLMYMSECNQTRGNKNSTLEKQFWYIFEKE